MSLDAQDAAYVKKLKKSGRDKKLIAAWLLLLLAMKRLQLSASLETIASELAPTTTTLAARVAAYVARQLHTTPEPTRRVAGPLLKDVSTHAVEALKLPPDERMARLGLIARAEVQNATVAVSRRAAFAGQRTITRRTASAKPCPKCESLAGTWPYPYRADIFWSHPNCACEFETNYDTPAS